MNPNLAVIFDEPQFSEAIHKKTALHKKVTGPSILLGFGF